MRKLVVVILVLAGLAFVYTRYGYLIQSYRNQPPSSPVTNSNPLILNPAQSDNELSFLQLPPGFAINYFSSDVPGARSLTRGDNGIIYVGSRPQGIVYALEDTDNDGRADNRYIVASGLDNPNGVAYKDGSLYVAEIGRIIAFRNIDSSYKSKPAYDVVTDSLPKETHHGWRYIKFGPDRKLYIGIGAPCNVCQRDDPFASIARINADGSDFEIVARGIRNTVGFDWNPTDNSLWFTDNGRDNMGDNLPSDELNRVGDNTNFGFPYCHQGDTLDPQFGKGQNCADYAAPTLKLGPHVAALGIDFYRGKVVIAEHGSWNRTDPIGYRLMTADVNGSQASNYQEFVTGWLDDNGKAKGRPVDLLELPDGSLLISDDLAGAIYRLTYSGN